MVTPSPRPAADVAPLPDPPPRLARAILAQLAMLLPRRSGHEHAAASLAAEGLPTHEQSFDVAVQLLEHLLDPEPPAAPAAALARLILLAQWPGVADQLAIQTAFGRAAGEASAQAVAWLIAEAEREGVSVDELVRRRIAEHRPILLPTAPLMLGEAHKRPEPERLRRGVALLGLVVVVAPAVLRPPLLGALAWLHWASGDRSLAVVRLEAALGIAPDFVLALGLREHFARRPQPNWAARAAA